MCAMVHGPHNGLLGPIINFNCNFFLDRIQYSKKAVHLLPQLSPGKKNCGKKRNIEKNENVQNRELGNKFANWPEQCEHIKTLDISRETKLAVCSQCGKYRSIQIPCEWRGKQRGVGASYCVTIDTGKSLQLISPRFTCVSLLRTIMCRRWSNLV